MVNSLYGRILLGTRSTIRLRHDCIYVTCHDLSKCSYYMLNVVPSVTLVLDLSMSCLLATAMASYTLDNPTQSYLIPYKKIQKQVGAILYG